MSNLTWTREVPARPGWYWWRDQEGEKFVVDVWKTSADGCFRVSCCRDYKPGGRSIELYADLGGEWSGPIPAPDEPGGAEEGSQC